MEHCVAEQHLRRLRQHVLVASSSSAAMAGALDGAARVYEHAEPLARSARADQVDGELEASVALLDTCAAARDALGAMRACALDVEAAVRRGDGEAVDRAARAYARLARKARADARRQQERQRRLGSSKHDSAADGGHSMQEARRLTAAVLERVVAALSRQVVGAAPGRQRQPSGWSTCVARAFQKRARVACEDAHEAAAPLSSKNLHDGEATARARRQLRALGDTIQHLEDGLELLFSRLVQCRVVLLNMRSL